MNRIDIPLQKYLAFITTVECGSLTRAGSITPSQPSAG